MSLIAKNIGETVMIGIPENGFVYFNGHNQVGRIILIEPGKSRKASPVSRWNTSMKRRFNYFIWHNNGRFYDDQSESHFLF